MLTVDIVRPVLQPTDSVRQKITDDKLDDFHGRNEPSDSCEHHFADGGPVRRLALTVLSGLPAGAAGRWLKPPQQDCSRGSPAPRGSSPVVQMSPLLV